MLHSRKNGFQTPIGCVLVMNLTHDASRLHTWDTDYNDVGMSQTKTIHTPIVYTLLILIRVMKVAQKSCFIVPFGSVFSCVCADVQMCFGLEKRLHITNFAGNICVNVRMCKCVFGYAPLYYLLTYYLELLSYISAHI